MAPAGGSRAASNPTHQQDSAAATCDGRQCAQISATQAGLRLHLATACCPAHTQSPLRTLCEEPSLPMGQSHRHHSRFSHTMLQATAPAVISTSSHPACRQGKAPPHARAVRVLRVHRGPCPAVGTLISIFSSKAYQTTMQCWTTNMQRNCCITLQWFPCCTAVRRKLIAAACTHLRVLHALAGPRPAPTSGWRQRRQPQTNPPTARLQGQTNSSTSRVVRHGSHAE